ncbi:sensor histidine kinase [Nocardia panacis]|uniref:Sensor histidine kinase n=2 Tax=Nocardia panacis TaxID=2340916 RepID=A0A3A4K6M1_9NOCA|nr:sensor histidine kinase [Nocardia panacis]
MLAVAWLFYLIGPIVDSWGSGHPVRAMIGAGCVVSFAVLVAASFAAAKQHEWEDVGEPPHPAAWVWLLLLGLTALTAGMVATLGPPALPTAIYISTVAIFTMPIRQSGYVAIVVSVTILVAILVMPSWRLGGLSIVLSFVPVVIWVTREVGKRGARLRLLARRQRAELAIVAERNRVARDVHDILGHSLTVITVKSELAQRLMDVDLARARTELADIERLAREALAGVRDTVGGLREVSLRGELANARSALAAAGIEAVLPEPDGLPAGEAELFGWVLREAITNVVRHSAARHCAVTVTSTSIEVLDDGRGMDRTASGSGLSGLRERVRAAGGTLTVSSTEGGGVRVAATVGAGR